MRKIDLTGIVYGRLTVVKSVGKSKYGNYMWECQCECGNNKTFFSSNLKRGLVRSCGCLSKELTIQRTQTHGLREHPLYCVWGNIKTRCYNKKCKYYKDYGGRGVKVSDSWLTFINFFNDVIDGYRDGLTLDRRDNDGDYCKENFRWATTKEQQNNTRKNVVIKYMGEVKTQVQWSRELGIGEHFILRRIKLGKSMSDVVYDFNLSKRAKRVNKNVLHD